MTVYEKYGNLAGATIAAKLRGVEVTICGSRSGHGYGGIGTKLKISSATYLGGLGANVQIRLSINGKVGNGGYLFIDELSLSNLDKKGLQEEVDRLEIEIQLTKAKIEYLKATKQEEFDETEFKVWNTLQTLKTKKTDIEKAKIIAELINN